MSAFSGDELLRKPVTMHGIPLGRPVDLILDLDGRGLGLDILCRDEVHRFLPLAAADISAEEITVASPLTLLEDAELAFYRKRGTTLNSLRGGSVSRAGTPVGKLDDLEFAADGSVATVVVADGSGRRRVPFSADVRLGPLTRRAPAA